MRPRTRSRAAESYAANILAHAQEDGIEGLVVQIVLARRTCIRSTAERQARAGAEGARASSGAAVRTEKVLLRMQGRDAELMSVLDRIRALETEQEGTLVGTWKCGGCARREGWRILPRGGRSRSRWASGSTSPRRSTGTSRCTRKRTGRCRDEPVAADVLRELGAQTRTFSGLVHVLTWWRAERSRRTLRAVPLELGSGPSCAERQNETNATFARVTRCMGEHDEHDVEEWPLSSWRIDALAHWLASDEVGRIYMLDRLRWSEPVAQRFMDETASVLRRRMQGRGLIP
jgi:hypothetical protein